MTNTQTGQSVELVIGGMTCASCAARVEKKLNRMDGVTATVNYATEKAKVTYADGMPVFGTCAGMIMLANEITGGIEGQETLGGLDVTVRRNAFGRQVDSFEADLTFAAFDTPYHAVFIRAPWVERVGRDVEVLSTVTSGRARRPSSSCR